VPSTANAVAEFVETQAERRIEPGGVFCLVGQRLGPADVHRKRLDARKRDGTPLYKHVIFPAHHDSLCDGEHRQWNGEHVFGSGCMTDIRRLNVTDWENVADSTSYRTVFQQEDINPESVLVQPAWLSGGTDLDGFEAPGCLDDRAWGEHPPRDVGRLVDYAVVDPSPTNYWAIEWWSFQPESKVNYLIWGDRRRMPAGSAKGLLDWDNSEQKFVGSMEEIQKASVVTGHPIRVWVIEANAAQRFLFDFDHFRRWLHRWPDVKVLRHQTAMNKLDPQYGVTILSTRYKTGHKRIPSLTNLGLDGRNFVRQIQKELTTYVVGSGAETDDCVMADWMGEYNLPKIVSASKRELGQQLGTDASLAPYLRNRNQVVSLVDA
jgi:hypothetical protein